MKALYFDGTSLSYVEDYKKPQITEGHSLIRVLVSAVCNTDREMLKGYRPDFSGILGHEFVGVVEDSYNKDFIGKRVVGEINEGCGECAYCRSGRERHCLTRKVIGIDKMDGCFAEYVLLADHCIHEVPEDLPTETALYTEPLAAALEIPALIHINPEDNAAIIGDGRLSLMIAQVLSLSGIDLTVIGHHAEKLALFKPYAKTVLEKDLPVTGSFEDTYELVVEASGAPASLNLAKNLVRNRGIITVKSTYAGNVSIDFSYFVVNEITIIGTRCGPFVPALELLKNGLIKLPPIEFHTLDDYENALNSKYFKVGFDFR